MSDKYNYSVIIPFRNDLKLLQVALDSIPDRRDIQILIIDNSIKSLENQFVNTHNYCDMKYLVSNPNGGAGCARNVGLENADGKWLLFLDADDFFTENAFNIFDEYVESNYDLIYFNITSCMLETRSQSKRHIPYCNRLNSYLSKGIESIIRYTFPTPYCKMIIRSMVVNGGIKFDETIVSNDVMFSMRCGYAAQNIFADKRIGYCVTENQTYGSLTKQHNPDNWEIRYKVAIEQYKMLKQIGHLEVAQSLIGYVYVALKDFGWKIFFHFIWLAYKEQVNLFIRFTQKGYIGISINRKY